MKKQFFTILLILSLGSLTWGAQGAKSELFDLKKSRQELEIMKGILSTTIGFVANEIQGKEETTHVFAGSSYRYSGMGTDISAYYLYGQGATFVIPISSLRSGSTGFGKLMALSGEPKLATVYEEGMSRAMYELQTEMNTMNSEMELRNEEMAVAAMEASHAAQSLLREAAEDQVKAPTAGVAGGVPGGVSGGVVGGVPGGVAGGVGSGIGIGRSTGAAQAAPAPLARPGSRATAVAPRPARTQVDREEAHRRLEDAQAKVRKAREEMEVRRQKLLEALTKVSGYLVEALANHGDSLTHVRPNEYINIIITTDEGMPLMGAGAEVRSRREVISVQKSTITDYKAGRITLDAFKQKVLQYGT
jgi:hypothetical protein